ncbi:MAG: hypothetical protein AB1607_05660 [Chloroflexota bacterium]
MNNERRTPLGDHPVIVVLGVVAACIAIFVFCTGFQSVAQILSNLFNVPVAPVDNPVDYPEFQQTNPPPTIDLQGLPAFGESRDINGLLVTVGPPNYDAGCDRTLEFEITLENTTNTPIVLGFGSYDDIQLLGSGNQNEKIRAYGDAGALTPRCFSSFEVETLPPNSKVKLSVGTTSSLGEYKYLDFVFGESTGRLAGQIWRLDLSKVYKIDINYFGQTINTEGLEATVGWADYSSECGRLSFKIWLKNTTEQSIILGLSESQLALYGDGNRLNITSASPFDSYECRFRFNNIETIQPNNGIPIAIYYKGSLSGLNYIDFVFESNNRLAGLKWRLILPR